MEIRYMDKMIQIHVRDMDKTMHPIEKKLLSKGYSHRIWEFATKELPPDKFKQIIMQSILAILDEHKKIGNSDVLRLLATNRLMNNKTKEAITRASMCRLRSFKMLTKKNQEYKYPYILIKPCANIQRLCFDEFCSRLGHELYKMTPVKYCSYNPFEKYLVDELNATIF